jgi:hypothetical protein
MSDGRGGAVARPGGSGRGGVAEQPDALSHRAGPTGLGSVAAPTDGAGSYRDARTGFQEAAEGGSATRN